VKKRIIELDVRTEEKHFPAGWLDNMSMVTYGASIKKYAQTTPWSFEKRNSRILCIFIQTIYFGLGLFKPKSNF
jgi:hypothetical protein